MSDRLPPVNARPGIRPRQSFARRLDIAARMALPAASTALLLLACGAPFAIPGQPVLQLCVALVCVFFWSLFRPASMPPAVVFLLGLLADLLQFSPPGVDVLLLLLAHGAAMRWRRELARQGFLRVWLAFVAVSVLAAALGWALTSLLLLRLLPPDAAVFQAGLGAGVYPLVAIVLWRVHRTLAEPRLA